MVGMSREGVAQEEIIMQVLETASERPEHSEGLQDERGQRVGECFP